MSIKIISDTIEFSTKGNNQIVDITDEVQGIIKNTDFAQGQVTLFAIGSTTGITTLEYEPGLVNFDVKAMYNKIAPYGFPYEQNNTWGDDNGAAHLRSALTGSSFVIPFINQKLTLGTWQQIVFIDFDTRSRTRKIVVQVLGS